MMFLKAMDILNDHNYEPNFNLKVIMDFEEELGSPRLPGAVLEYKDQLVADMLVIFDGPIFLKMANNSLKMAKLFFFFFSIRPTSNYFVIFPLGSG